MVGRVEHALDKKYQDACRKNCASLASGSGRSTGMMVVGT
jgi:hypothetical protein